MINGVVVTKKHRDEDLQSEGIHLESVRPFARFALALLLIYLCWRMMAPFLAALCWAFALAVITDPIHERLVRMGFRSTFAALCLIVLITMLLIGPGVFLAGALARETVDFVSRINPESQVGDLRHLIEMNKVTGPLFGWLDSQYDLPQEALRFAGAAGTWLSATASTFLKGSLWTLTQLTVTMFVCFYFLRDGRSIWKRVRAVIPLPLDQTDLICVRLTRTIRVALGGKLVVAGIQGTLGGLMFSWLGLSAPVFWGFIMGMLSVLPVLGAFVIWVPAASMFAIQGDWWHALILTGWGLLIIHPVDNLLGPVLVGTTLRMHTLLMFFSIVGGIAAFGAAGIVLGPVTITIAVSLLEIAEQKHKREAIAKAEPGLFCGV